MGDIKLTRADFLKYDKLLDMKQKEAGVVEAACARVSGEMATRQSYAMMTFTVITVLFVCLSDSQPRNCFHI